jgi:hypothetical protein
MTSGVPVAASAEMRIGGPLARAALRVVVIAAPGRVVATEATPQAGVQAVATRAVAGATRAAPAVAGRLVVMRVEAAGRAEAMRAVRAAGGPEVATGAERQVVAPAAIDPRRVVRSGGTPAAVERAADTRAAGPEARMTRRSAAAVVTGSARAPVLAGMSRLRVDSTDRAAAIRADRAMAVIKVVRALGVPTRAGRAPADTRADPAVAPDTRVDPAVAPDTRVDPAVAPDTRVDPAVAPDTRVDPAVAPDTRADPAVAPDTRADPAVAPDTRADPAVAIKAGLTAVSRSGRVVIRQSQAATTQPTAAGRAAPVVKGDPAGLSNGPTGRGQVRQGAPTVPCGEGSPEAAVGTATGRASSETPPIVDGPAARTVAADPPAGDRGATTMTLRWDRGERDDRRLWRAAEISAGEGPSAEPLPPAAISGTPRPGVVRPDRSVRSPSAHPTLSGASR